MAKTLMRTGMEKRDMGIKQCEFVVNWPGCSEMESEQESGVT